MKTISTVGMTKERWLLERKIGSSDVSAILGLNPWKTPLQVYEEKTAEKPPETEETRAMQRGHKMEDTVAEMYMEEERRKVVRDNKIRVHPGFEFLRCNLDRIILPNESEGRGLLEIKTATSMAAKSWEAEIPTWFFTQVQHQFDVSCLRWGALALLIIDTWELKVIPLVPDLDFIKAQRSVLVDFWTNHVVPHVPPSPTVSDFELMLSRPGLAVEASEETIAWVGQLQRVKRELKEIETAKDNLETKIKAEIGDAEILSTGGRVLATWKSQTQKRFDEKRFKAEQAETAAGYVKEIQFRTLRLKSTTEEI